MNDPRVHGPFSVAGITIAGAIDQHQKFQMLPPLTKAQARAGRGAWVIVMSYELLPVAKTLGETAFFVWLAALALGGLSLVVGLRGAHGGPRDVMQAVAWLAGLGCCAGALAFRVYLPSDERFLNFLLHGLYAAFLAMCAVRMWLALRGPEHDAQKMVAADIAANDFDWK